MRRKKPCLLLLQVSSVLSRYASGCDRCTFDGLEDVTNCKDYGLIDNTILVAWSIASEECMDAFDIRISSTDPLLICSSVSSFVNELKFGSSLTVAKMGLGISEGGFFNDDGTLIDQITVAAQVIDCQTSESDCYNAMKSYFAATNGQKEMEDVCATLQDAVVKDRQLEQSIIRNRLCQEDRDGTTIPTYCSPLWDQLASEMQKHDDMTCAAFAMGTQIPGCEMEEGGAMGDEVATDTTSMGSVGVKSYSIITIIFSIVNTCVVFFLE